MNEMNRWLAAYDRRRTSGIEGSNKALLSSKWDLESMSWDEIREIPIPALGEGMNFGKGCEALRKSWFALKRSRAEGSYYNMELELRINRIQSHLGFERTIFDDLDQEWVDNELSMEQQKEEQDEWLADEELSEEESQLNQQLRKEERYEAGCGLDDDEVENDEVGR